MADATTTTTTADTTATTTAAPWHAGIEAETIGFWQNKGVDLADPKAVFTGISKQYRELEKHIGVPADQLLKMPKADAKPEDLRAFYQRLGAPADPKEYDFSGVKFNGEDLEPGFADTMRGALNAAFVSKDKASTIVSAVVKYLEDADKAEGAVNAAKFAEEKAALARNWGTNYDFNHLKAMEGARRAGLSPETVKAMESVMGYAGVMEHCRRIGSGTSEDMWVSSGATGGGNPTTREGAIDRKAQLEGDPAWVARYLAGGRAENDEMRGIITMIDGPA